MTVLAFQSLFNVPVPKEVTQTPVQGADRDITPIPLKQPRFSTAAMAATGLFLVLSPADMLRSDTPWPIHGDQVQSFQPPHRNSEQKGASLADGERGIAAPYSNWRNAGWAVDQPHLPHPKPERSSVLFGARELALSLVTTLQTSAYAFGYDEPHVLARAVPSVIARAIAASGKSQFVAFDLQPFTEVQAVQPPHPRPEQKSAALADGDRGIVAPYIRFFVPGWDVQPPPPPHPRPERSGAIAPSVSIDATYINWRNAGWELQPHQPPHGRPERGGAVAPKDDGNQYQLQNWQNVGWEIAPHQPQHARPERAGSIQPLSNVEAVYSNWRLFGFDPPTNALRKPPVVAPIIAKSDGNDAAFQNWQNAGWETQPVQPPHGRPERAGSIQPLVNVDARYVDWRSVGFELQPTNPRKGYALAAGIAPKSDGNEAQFQFWQNAGWEIAPVQPPHRNSERAGAVQPLVHIEAVYADWANDGWQIQGQQQRLRSEKRGGLFGFADLPINVVTALQTSAYPWGYEAPPVIARTPPTVARSSAASGKSQFVSFTLQPFTEIQHYQPQHLRFERSSVQIIGDGGIQYPILTGLQTATYPFGVDGPFVYPRKAYERAAAIAPKSDGTDARFVVWRNGGWEVQPPQPPHRGNEHRLAAVLRGDDGQQAALLLWQNTGWEIAPVQPQHVRTERSGSLLPPLNIDALYVPSVTPEPAEPPTAGGGKRRKPVRPIWDRPIEQTRPTLPVSELRAPELPPSAIRARIAPAGALDKIRDQLTASTRAAPTTQERKPFQFNLTLARSRINEANDTATGKALAEYGLVVAQVRAHEHPDAASAFAQVTVAAFLRAVEAPDRIAAAANQHPFRLAAAMMRDDQDEIRSTALTDDDDEALRLLFDDDDDDEAMMLLDDDGTEE